MSLLLVHRPTTTSTRLERIDRLNWVAGRSFDAGPLTQLPRHLPFGWKSAAEPLVERLISLQVAANRANSKTRRLHLLHRDADSPAHGNDLNQIFEALESDRQSTTLFPKRPAAIRLFVAQSGNKRRT